MTNKEALQEVAQIPLSDAAIEKAFLDKASEYSLSSSGEYSSENEKAIDAIAIKVLSNFLDADVSEGGYSITYKDSIQKKIERLSKKWGFSNNDRPEIRDISFLW